MLRIIEYISFIRNTKVKSFIETTRTDLIAEYQDRQPKQKGVPQARRVLFIDKRQVLPENDKSDELWSRVFN